MHDGAVNDCPQVRLCQRKLRARHSKFEHVQTCAVRQEKELATPLLLAKRTCDSHFVTYTQRRDFLK